MRRAGGARDTHSPLEPVEAGTEAADKRLEHEKLATPTSRSALCCHPGRAACRGTYSACGRAINHGAVAARSADTLGGRSRRRDHPLRRLRKTFPTTPTCRPSLQHINTIKGINAIGDTSAANPECAHLAHRRGGRACLYGGQLMLGGSLDWRHPIGSRSGPWIPCSRRAQLVTTARVAAPSRPVRELGNQNLRPGNAK